MANNPAAPHWRPLFEARGKPFTDLVFVQNAYFISQQSGEIWRVVRPEAPGSLFATVKVNSTGEAGLNALATDGTHLWALYVAPDALITLAEINLSNGEAAPLATFGYAETLHYQHNAAGLLFAGGDLLAGVGDNEVALSAQDDALPFGKVWAFNLAAGKTRLVARGLRNPWAIVKLGDEIYVADVGENKFEEINIYGEGTNYGWPCFEALEPRLYFPSLCNALVWTPPHVQYGRDLGHAIVGLAVINNEPAYADYTGVIRTFNHHTLQEIGGRISRLTQTNKGAAMLWFVYGTAHAEIYE